MSPKKSKKEKRKLAVVDLEDIAGTDIMPHITLSKEESEQVIKCAKPSLTCFNLLA